MTVNIPALPFALAWEGDVEPPSWQVTDTGLEATAAPKSDWYVYAPDPASWAPTNGARLLGIPPEGDWQLSARITVDFNGTYDAGTLFVLADDAHWSKLCFEYSPDRQGMVVSVVTRGTSDDANGWNIEGDTVWLRVTRLGQGFVFHASSDGTRWEFARSFAFGVDAPIKAGFGVQAPEGEGCKVTFGEIAFKQETLSDLRDGS
jgi:regulation of enolase protein 1 (concanavalin A-like superfamily)